MNNTLERIIAAWTLATGRPLPFLPEPKEIPDDFPVFFPLIGLAVGLACSLAAWFVVWLFAPCVQRGPRTHAETVSKPLSGRGTGAGGEMRTLASGPVAR